ncbi:FAD:protein FMN transferase [Sedimentisphaera salicampi]|uniref:FAD:protein FMN transferase n=1 Tax=Sedimentisphaera salicampi TaxID=1941349 RepID=UPI000B9CD31B|nr:FAD:protein FMN transferase [Sedimentisphaera salicampi]OXU16067.1 Thiamine biosynthesis lipoprotein ApbE precursor [Sedimentisphaera salicampi]
MNTRFNLVLPSVDFEHSEEIFEQVKTEVLRLEKVFSRFDSEAELYRFNQSSEKDIITVSGDLSKALRICKDYSEKTDGYFNPSYSGEIDLGGIGKGYALEEVRKILLDYALSRAFVSFGESSIYGLGSHPHGNCWEVAVCNPFRKDESLDNFKLLNSSLSVSGFSVLKNGVSGYHIVDPKTGRLAQNNMLVCVLSDSSIESEVISTAVYASSGKWLPGKDLFPSIKTAVIELNGNGEIIRKHYV